MDISAQAYHHNQANHWSDVLKKASNPSVLFNRQYMAYHADRFHDCSLVIYKKGKPIGIFPAHQKDGIVYSHQGLTYGGICATPQRQEVWLAMFAAVLAYYQTKSIETIHYRPTPAYLHPQMVMPDSLALHHANAKLIHTSFNLVVLKTQLTHWSTLRKRMLNKAQSANLVLETPVSWEPFWALLTENLDQRHGVSATHSLEEIRWLKAQNPDSLHLLTASKNRQLCGGILYLKHTHCIHAQYIAANQTGRDNGALEWIMASLMEQYPDLCLSLGISDWRSRPGINHGLFRWKEGFNAQPFAHHSFKLATAAHRQLSAVFS